MARFVLTYRNRTDDFLSLAEDVARDHLLPDSPFGNPGQAQTPGLEPFRQAAGAVLIRPPEEIGEGTLEIAATDPMRSPAIGASRSEPLRRGQTVKLRKQGLRRDVQEKARALYLLLQQPSGTSVRG